MVTATLPTPASPLPDPPRQVAPAGLWLSGTFSSLRHRNYRLYFVGQLVSLTGTWVQTAALTWLAFHLTGQSSWAALVGAAQVLPTLPLGVWGGSLADRWPRRPLIAVTQTCFLALALLLAGLSAAGLASPAWLLAVALGVGVVNAVDTPARLAFVIDLVGRDDLANAVALNSLTFNLARALGPAVAAVLLGALGPGACFLVNALTFVAVLAALAAMRLPPGGGCAATRRAAGNLGAAFSFLGGRPDLVRLLALAGALALFGWPLLSLLPAVAVERLGADEHGYGWMLSAVGAGALVGALNVASLTRHRGTLLACGVGLCSLALLGLSVVTSLPAAVVCCAAAGGGLILFFATGQAAMQLGSGDHNRGRVMGVWLMVLSGSHPLGHLLAGRLADAWGVAPVLAGCAAGVAVAGALAWLAARLGWPRGAGGSVRA